MATKGQKRKDKDRIVLKAGESQRPNGTYDYRWTGPDGKRHAVYAKNLEELREKESQIQNDSFSGLKAEARCVTVNEMFDLWCQIKRGLKDNTFENYKYMYNLFVRPNFGKKRIYDLKKSEVKRFYNHLVDERNVQASTVDTIHTVLHQVLQMAVDDRYIANNPSDGVLKELKQSHVFKTEKRRGLTKLEQELLLTYLSTHPTYNHWYPIFAVLIGTGMRIGEVAGLRWCDIDLEDGMIDVNPTLVYYDHRDSEREPVFGRCPCWTSSKRHFKWNVNISRKLALPVMWSLTAIRISYLSTVKVGPSTRGHLTRLSEELFGTAMMRFCRKVKKIRYCFLISAAIHFGIPLQHECVRLA